MYLHLGTSMILKDFHLSRIDNVDFDCTVDEFKGRVAEHINFLKENIEIAYCGMILKESTTLKENGLQQGFVVNVLQKKEKDVSTPPISAADLDLQDIVRVFQVLATRNAYRRVLQRLNKPAVLENIILTTPGLCNDDIALVILQHPELIAKLGDINAVKKVIEEHPTLACAAKNLVAAVQNDMFASPSASTSMAPTIMGVMGASDDEEMESLSNSDSQNRTPETSEDGEHPVNVITSSQVAAALASTTAAVSRNSSSGPSGSGITPEMMSAALQQAIASTSSQSPASTSVSTPTPVPAPEARSDNVVTAAKLIELRKFGFTNDARNVEALQIANGDLETAVNLLLNGLHEDV